MIYLMLNLFIGRCPLCLECLELHEILTQNNKTFSKIQYFTLSQNHNHWWSKPFYKHILRFYKDIWTFLVSLKFEVVVVSAKFNSTGISIRNEFQFGKLKLRDKNWEIGIQYGVCHTFTMCKTSTKTFSMKIINKSPRL